MYRTLFQPCIDYYITVWGYPADKYLNKVQCNMNRSARIITGDVEYGMRGVELLNQVVKGRAWLLYEFNCLVWKLWKLQNSVQRDSSVW